MKGMKKFTQRRLTKLQKYALMRNFSSMGEDPLSPLDGRYMDKVKPLMSCFSEKGFNKYRINVEVNWLKYLIQNDLTSSDIGGDRGIVVQKLDKILENLENTEFHKRVKEFESVTNHDIKAVEYYVKEVLKADPDLERKFYIF